MSNVLKKSLYEMYRNEESVLQLFDQIDFSALSVKFAQELTKRMSAEDCIKAQEILNSKLVKDYQEVCYEATLACTRAISDLLDLVLVNNIDGEMH